MDSSVLALVRQACDRLQVVGVDAIILVAFYPNTTWKKPCSDALNVGLITTLRSF